MSTGTSQCHKCGQVYDDYIPCRCATPTLKARFLAACALPEMHEHASPTVYAGHSAENNRLRPILEAAAECVAALEFGVKQANGIRNAWCGMWVDCVKCKVPWAYGGNWNDKGPGDVCPDCAQASALAKLKEVLP